MKPGDSPTREGSEGYERVCLDCSGTMDWMWGGEITYFQCKTCKRVEPCPSGSIKYQHGKVIESKLDYHGLSGPYTGDGFNQILKDRLTRKDAQS